MKLKKELPLLLIVLIPFIYLAYIWNDLPETIPTHWNWKGEIDDWGKKTTAILIPFILPFFVYLIFLVVPKIDPKGKIESMGKKYDSLRFIIILFMSLLAIFILYSMKDQNLANPNLIIMGIGFLYVALGNYMKTLKANYFIGIRTPWTLENESVWKDTHVLGGKLWFMGGLIIIVCSLLLENKLNTILFIIITSIISIIPIVYSYRTFKSLKKNN